MAGPAAGERGPADECGEARLHWVFGFGSLMWDPGFEARESRPARIFGYHRRFSVLSYESWGSRAEPGLAVALHAGGSCHGLAYGVAPADWPGVEAYLRHRERAYRHVRVPCRTPAGTVRALTFVSDRGHPRSAPDLAPERVLRHLALGVGSKGSSRAYLANTIACLRARGLDPGPYLGGLERAVAAVADRTG